MLMDWRGDEGFVDSCQVRGGWEWWFVRMVGRRMGCWDAESRKFDCLRFCRATQHRRQRGQSSTDVTIPPEPQPLFVNETSLIRDLSKTPDWKGLGYGKVKVQYTRGC